MANKLLIIGINEYSDFNNLKSSVKDVLDFKNTLLEKFDFDESNILELLNENATNKNILEKFVDLVKNTKNTDNLIVYYSGHGNYDSDLEMGYWVPTDGKDKDYSTWIPNSTIISYLERIKAKHIFIISDSCFSNSFLILNSAKNIKDYYDYESRWALCSAFETAIDSDGESNTLFAETIINYLEQSEDDIRVSELIEEVKRNFLINKLQKPQGYPISINGHKGGEFTFKIKHKIDNRGLKGYLDFEKILKIYKRNSDFTELSKYEDRGNKIGYHLFQEVDSVIKKATYYLYLYEGVIQIKTLRHLQENHPKIFNEKNLVIFIPIEKQIKNAEIRKKNIQEKFKPISLFYIDEFIRQHCTPKVILEDDSKYLNISNFISPILKKEHKEVENFYHNWYEKSEEPILVLKGGGGIGKTTLAQYFADITISLYSNPYILFIDSIQIKDNLLKSKNRHNLNLYNFYEALFEITDNIEDKLSEELFKINIDAGNILIIIDGLDEVISKIPNFNVNEFINSIKESTNELGNGKIIITCRTYFWDKNDFPDNDFSIIELEPFNERQAQDFFSKSFKNEVSKIKRSLRLANGFKYPGTEKENIYHPYVLDIIRSIIETDTSNFEFDFEFIDSIYLKQNNKNDYIVFKVCDRERRRVGQISVDEQISFFIHFAVKKRGIINITNFKNELEESLERTIDNVNVEAFKSHPFLKFDDNVLFKYDFLSDLFKSIYINTFFNFESSNFKITKYFMDIINENCWFGSALNNDIVNRVQHWNDDDVLLISDIINQLENSDNEKGSVKKKTIANILNLCLSINHKFKPNNVDSNTELLVNLFGKGQNKLENIHLININSDQNVRFNFANLEIHNSTIDNYSSFWKCNFNENTRFIKCELFNIKLKEKDTTINKLNFIDCTFDSNIESSLKSVDSLSKSKKENLMSFLLDFFHLFVSNGKLGRQWEHNVIEPRYAGINKLNIEYNKTIKVLRKNDVLIVTKELSKNKFSISEKYKDDINNFINSKTIPDVIINIFNDLKD